MLRNMGMNMTLPTMNNSMGTPLCPIYFYLFQEELMNMATFTVTKRKNKTSTTWQYDVKDPSFKSGKKRKSGICILSDIIENRITKVFLSIYFRTKQNETETF